MKQIKIELNSPATLRPIGLVGMVFCHLDDYEDDAQHSKITKLILAI